MAEKQRLSESDTIILSLHDRWWKKILAGEKQLEIRKTRPAGKGPFRVLVYVTGTGEIKGEFICNSFFKIRTIPEVKSRTGLLEVDVPGASCLTGQQLKEYAGEALVGLVSVTGEGIRHAAQIKPVRAEKTAAVLAVLQRGRRAGH